AIQLDGAETANCQKQGRRLAAGASNYPNRIVNLQQTTVVDVEVAFSGLTTVGRIVAFEITPGRQNTTAACSVVETTNLKRSPDYPFRTRSCNGARPSPAGIHNT